VGVGGSGGEPGGATGGGGAPESGGAVGTGSGGVGACAGPLTFAEPDVEATVRDLIGVPSGPIAPQMVVGLRSLIRLMFADVPSCAPFDCGHPSPPIRDSWITTLDGLECLTDVEELALDSWSVPDFGSLAALPHLTELDLGLAPDLSLLPDLPHLTGLRAMMTTTDLARLASFTALVTLDLGAIDLSAPGTLDPLAGLTALQDLGVVGRVSDLGFISRLTNLTKVYLAGNDITNLQPLVDNLGIGAGDTVDLTDNPINCRAQARQLRSLRARGVTVLLPACD
jgi:internalin A